MEEKKNPIIADISSKCCKCEPFELGFIEACKDRSNCLYGSISWDDKFGLVEVGKKEINMENKKAVIDGVGEDAEVVVNAAGGKQSKSPMAMHLVDPLFLEGIFRNKAEELEYYDRDDCSCVDAEDITKHGQYMAIVYIAKFMQNDEKFYLLHALDELCEDEIQQVINIAKILQYGADRYAPNNWRLIPEEEHINHALVHLIAHLAGDTQDDHINHAMCRLMMAYATEKSDKFEYGAYVA